MYDLEARTPGPSLRLLGAMVAISLALSLNGMAAYTAIDPSDYSFTQTAVDVNYLNDAGNRAIEITATMEFTNNSGATLDGTRFMWAWGIGYHLYAAQPDEVFERRWDPVSEKFMFNGHDSLYDGEAGTSMQVLSMDGLMPFSETDLDPNADAEDFTWLGVDTGQVPLSAYPDLFVDPNNSVPYQEIGDVLPGGTVVFQISSRTEYPNDPVPSGLGIWGLPVFLELSPVPEPATGMVLMMLAGLTLLRRERAAART